jgi:YHS domain-containing protein
MATGPVCFAIVDDDDARFTSTYKRSEVSFLHELLQKKFDENPQRYSQIPSDVNISQGGASC